MCVYIAYYIPYSDQLILLVRLYTISSKDYASPSSEQDMYLQDSEQDMHTCLDRSRSKRCCYVVSADNKNELELEYWVSSHISHVSLGHACNGMECLWEPMIASRFAVIITLSLVLADNR